MYYIRLLTGWSGVEIKCNVRVALPKLFKLDQKSKKQKLRAYCKYILYLKAKFLTAMEVWLGGFFFFEWLNKSYSESWV